MRIDSSGNVGIGIAPVSGARLTLGTGAVANEILSFASATGGNAELRNTSSTGSFTFTNSDGSSEKMRITSAGKVGIGTTSPSSLLHLESASSPTLRLVDTTNSVTLLAFAQDSNTGFGNFSNHPIIFYTNSTTALTLDTSQNATFAGNVSLADSKKIKLGAGEDLTLVHNSTNSFLTNDTGDLYIRNNANDKDIIFQSDDGSGGLAEYIRIDGSAVKTTINKEMQFFALFLI